MARFRIDLYRARKNLAGTLHRKIICMLYLYVAFNSKHQSIKVDLEVIVDVTVSTKRKHYRPGPFSPSGMGNIPG